MSSKEAQAHKGVREALDALATAPTEQRIDCLTHIIRSSKQPQIREWAVQRLAGGSPDGAWVVCWDLIVHGTRQEQVNAAGLCTWRPESLLTLAEIAADPGTPQPMRQAAIQAVRGRAPDLAERLARQ